jgi:hypothetical protein
MDISSINILDLKYLTNSHIYSTLKKKNKVTTIDFQDLEFYKKRIFQTAENILLKKKTEKHLVGSFYSFAENCVNHFKFIDKAEIIQNDYKSLSPKKSNKKYKKIDVTASNQIIMREKKTRIPKITDHINIKVNKNKKKKTHIPKKRSIDLTDPKFKIKGIK